MLSHFIKLKSNLPVGCWVFRRCSAPRARGGSPTPAASPTWAFADSFCKLLGTCELETESHFSGFVVRIKSSELTLKSKFIHWTFKGFSKQFSGPQLKGPAETSYYRAIFCSPLQWFHCLRSPDSFLAALPLLSELDVGLRNENGLVRELLCGFLHFVSSLIDIFRWLTCFWH